MELNSKEYQIYKNINFVKRYEVLSSSFQFEDRLDYSNEEVLILIASLGYKAKYVKNNNFFKIEDKINGIKFYLNICLKYSNVELIIGAAEIEKDLYITGSVFGGLYKDLKYAEGVDLENNIRDPKFRNYTDLEVILKETFSIYEDFKAELLKQDGITIEKSNTIIGLDKTVLEEKIELLIKLLKDSKKPSSQFFETILEEIRSNKKQEALNKLRTSFVITQYANFNFNEEKLLDEIIEIASL